MGAPKLTEAEALHIAAWCVRAERRQSGRFSWPTDGLAYETHIAFAQHRNKNWGGGSETEFVEFVREYVRANRGVQS